MRRPIRWLAAGFLATLAIFGAQRVESRTCSPDRFETLQLEIQSVERGSEEVDDLSRWKSSADRTLDVELRAGAEGWATFEIDTNTADYLWMTFEPASDQGGNT